MINVVVSILLSAGALMLITYIVPGIVIADFMTAVIAAFVLGLLNTFLKPILVLLTLPVNFITFGLFSWVLSAFTLWLAGRIVPGFEVESFVSALVGGILLAFLASLLQTLIKR